MRRPSVRISNEPTTLSDAIAKANTLYGLGLPLLNDVKGTMFYEMWQLSVTIQQPGPNPGELMVITATEEFPLFGGLSADVTLNVVQGDAEAERPAARADLALQSIPSIPRPRASRARR